MRGTGLRIGDPRKWSSFAEHKKRSTPAWLLSPSVCVLVVGSVRVKVSTRSELERPSTASCV